MPPRFLAALVATSLSSLLVSASASADDTCQPSRLMVLLDKSSSMLNPIADQTKWDVAKSALGDLSSSYQSQLEIGLSVFPQEGECSAGQVTVEPAMNSKDALLSALSEPPPAGGNWTPMAETLEAASHFAALNDPDIPSYAVLITDGWQYCYPYDPATRFSPVDAVQQLNMAGITTFVVGFGDGVDVATLNQVAVAAGTAIPGCDPNGEEPGAANPCYYQADSPAQLLNALMTVAQQIPNEEICDGLDNDCDGEVDEGLVQACSTECGQGESVCQAGAWATCDAPVSEYEICDGLDNDCDGQADELDADDDGSGLCGPDSTCTDGECLEPGQPAGAVTGCGCNLDGASQGGALGSLLPLFLGLFLFRRRRA